jgi:hypothetical protein
MDEEEEEEEDEERNESSGGDNVDNALVARNIMKESTISAGYSDLGAHVTINHGGH